MSFNTEILQKASNEARGLAIDAVIAAEKTGHLGLPLGSAEVGASLFGHALRFNPTNSRWLNRDRFVLSAGHGSTFLYGWLHLSGYDLSLDDLAKFRHLHSKTPGHPEFRETDGVEATTGPLGQGIGNAVGMAMSGKMAEAHFNTADHTIFDYKVVCLAGDGCLQEGVAQEACSFAGHNALDNLILIYDSNDVTLDAQADVSQSENVTQKFEAYGFEVSTVDGHDITAFLGAYEKAKSSTAGKPQLIIARTEIGRGIPEVAGTSAAHGEGGAAFAESARAGLGLPEGSFYVSDEVRSYFAEMAEKRTAENTEWDSLYAEWKSANEEKAQLLEDGYARKLPSVDELFASIPEAGDKAMATRVSGGKVLDVLAKKLSLIISGSADLHGSTKNYLSDAGGDFSKENRLGRNIRFGIREHAMGAIVNGFSYEGLFMASGATFFTFSDYMRPSVRLSALAKLPSLWYWTHDSVGVGVDGPTHQPVETMSSLRNIPGLDMIKPADAEEAAGAIVAAFERTDGPTGLSLSRQNLPDLTEIPVKTRREGVLKGGYIARKETSALSGIILSCGSELSMALEAANELGEGVRVISMPCFERFERQSSEYRESVLPADCRKRLAVEAGVSDSWYRYVGLDGKVVGIDRFGLSAPGDIVLKELGVTVEAVVAVARDLAF
ncbi:MAG: transketolase [Opitutaceae bacterium]|nr:transketolase [Opitutaceae bacterium]